MAEVYKRKVYFCGQNCIESFRTTRINPEFKKLPIENFYSAGATNSGPVALLYRKYGAKQLKLPQNYDTSVLFFNCKGDLLRMVAFQLKERIILFEFTTEQQLLIIYANGNYFVIDPATANVKQGSIFIDDDLKNSSKNRCSGAQMVGDKIVILREKVLGVVENIGLPWKGYQAMKLHLDNPIFNCSLNENGQLQIIYLNGAGLIELFNVKKWQEGSSPPFTLYTNQALKSNVNNLISIIKQEEKLGFVLTDRTILARVNFGTLIFPYNNGVTINKEDPISKSQSKSKYRNFYKIGFLDNTLYFYDRVRLIFLSLSEPQIQTRNLSLTSILVESKNGIRLLDEHVFIFRVIHNAMYFSLVDKEEIAIKTLKYSTKEQCEDYDHFKELTSIYDSFIEKKPIKLEYLQTISTYVSKIWEKIMKMASLYIDPGEQLMTLKFANFLQNYFRFDIRSDTIKILAKELRVVNNLRHQNLNRWITYDQFLTLKASEKFLLLLLRYNMHFVADMIYQDSRSKEKIFNHWARCKIQKETEATALEEIKSRYQQMKVAIGPTYVFTDLARYCLNNKQRNLINLALQLIQLEPHPARRAIVFLFIFLSKKQADSVDKLLAYAQQSKNTSTIHQTIQSLRRTSQDQQWLPDRAWLEILPKKPILEYHYIRILKSNNDTEELRRYLTLNKLYVEMSYITLGKQLAKLENPTLQAATELITKEHSKSLISLSEQLQKCTKRSGVQVLRELKNKKYPITQEDANVLTKDGQLEVLAQMIIRKDSNLPLATRILRKIKSDKVYSLLIRKGKIKDAIQQAFSRKNKEMLEELIPMADEGLQPLAKQLYDELTKTR